MLVVNNYTIAIVMKNEMAYKNYNGDLDPYSSPHVLSAHLKYLITLALIIIC